jgi:peptidyl-tRNA hydrolase, PTH1 family
VADESKRQWLLVGLGNPGAEYEWTRHNLGFMLIDKLAQETQVAVKRRECQALVGRESLEGQIVTLAKPQTFMNLSGKAVGCLLEKTNSLERPQLLVIVDDLALPFGSIRIRERGSDGGHNGLKSISATLGTNEFMRLRIGIQPEHPVTDTKQFVLDSFPRSMRTEVEKVIERAAEAVHVVLRDGILKAMCQYN